MGETGKVFGNPLHDYTKMLLSAVPELHRKWQPEAGGQAAEQTSPVTPNGRAVPVTALEPPELREAEAGHLVAEPE
jgi:ABC-type oligopeptide transport system ATPase subunit